MTTRNDFGYHTVEDEWLASYCAGGLSSAKRLVLSCQAAINPDLSGRITTMETVGGALLETAKGETLSDNFMAHIFDQIETPAPSMISPASDADSDHERDSEAQFEGWEPPQLKAFLKQANKPLKWKNMGFGVARMPLFQDGSEKLYLLKAKPGTKMPMHSHHGEEWALILQGGYHVGREGYARGDVHRENEDCTHRPIIDDDGEDCITLVACEGGLKFVNPVLKLLKPILGV